jgi:hypothetical protein
MSTSGRRRGEAREREVPMNAREFRIRLNDVLVTAETNQRYHQHEQTRLWWWDKAVKITVAVLALLALLAVFLPHEYKNWEIGVAFLAAVAAVVLNVVPVGEWVTESGELFRSWSDLYLSAEQLELRTQDLFDEDEAPDLRVERLMELVGKQSQLDATERAPNKKLLSDCQDYVEKRRGLFVEPTEEVATHG